MLMKDYPLHYWRENGIFACETHKGEFMEFCVARLLGDGSSVLGRLIIELEKGGRDLGACRAELAALQQIARDSGMTGTMVFIDKLGSRGRDGSERGYGVSSGWVWNERTGGWIRSDGGH